MNDKKFNFVLLNFKNEDINFSPAINAIAFEDFHCDGVEEFSLEESRVDEILGSRAYSGGDVPESLIDEVQAATLSTKDVTYKYFFYQGDFELNTSGFVFFIKENYPEISLFTAQKNFEDWNAEWKKFYVPIVVSDKLEIIPEWLASSEYRSDKDQVLIYPGMGFGTGTHETTYLCLKLFEQIRHKFNSKSTVLDFGCGSGILGIAAIKTTQAKTNFCDIDKSALDNCVQNLILNFDGENLEGTELFLRDRLKNNTYDLVFANILEHVLILEKNVLYESLNSSGYLIVSGILNNQVENILQKFSKLKAISVIKKGDWSAVLFQS